MVVAVKGAAGRFKETRRFDIRFLIIYLYGKANTQRLGGHAESSAVPALKAIGKSIMQTFPLPPAIAQLLEARNALRRHYEAILRGQGSQVELKFTLDGNLVGDIGEAIAAELFGVRLVEAKSTEGIDGFAKDGRTVQVKATGTKRGPAFRQTEIRAHHLLFFCLDFEAATGIVAYNGPERHVTKYLPEVFSGQCSVSRPRIRLADSLVMDSERLLRL